MPTFDAGYMYDAIFLLVETIKNSSNETDKIKDNLLNVKDFNGATGTISILPNGDSKVSLSLTTYKDGKQISIGMEEK